MSGTGDPPDVGGVRTPSGPPAPDIASATARLGTYVWWATSLFELTGAWARSETRTRVKRFLAGAAGRFAWQASEWNDRLPRLREVDRAVVVCPPDAESEQRIRTLGGLTATDDRLRALQGITGDLQELFAEHAAAAEPVRDGAVLRSLRRVGDDLDGLERDMMALDGSSD